MPGSPSLAHDSPLGSVATSGRNRRVARRALGRDPLARDIAIVLAVKLVAILLLWFAFFRPADAPSSAPNTQAVVEHIAAPATPSEVPVVAH